MVEEALSGFDILVALGAHDEAYVQTLHAEFDKDNAVKDCHDIEGLKAELGGAPDPTRTLIVASQTVAAQLSAMEGNPASDIPMLVIAPADHDVDEYTEAMRLHHGRFEYLNRVESPDPRRLVRTLALIAKDGPLGVAI